MALIAAALALKLAFRSAITSAFAIRLPKIKTKKIVSPIADRNFKIYSARMDKPLLLRDLPYTGHTSFITCVPSLIAKRRLS